MSSVSGKSSGICCTHSTVVGGGSTGCGFEEFWPPAKIANGAAITATAAMPPTAANVLLRRRILSPRRRTSAAGRGFMGGPGMLKFSSSSMGSGMAESFLVREEQREGCAASAEPGLDGSFGDADLAGDVVDRE